MSRPEPELLPLLAALLLPGPEAERLLGLAPGGAGEPGRVAAARAEGREPLLRALARAARPTWPELRRRAWRCAAVERPRVADLLSRAGEGRALPAGVAAALARLVRERLGSEMP